MNNITTINDKSVKASEIIRKKLLDCGGRVSVTQYNSDSCDIVISSDGRSLTTDKIQHNKLAYEFRVFDIIVDLLREQGGRARKGGARNKENKVGMGNCTEDTVVGAIAVRYWGKSYGESTFDPMFMIAAVLEWAGIVHNRRGYLELTTEYKALLGAKQL